MKKVVTLQFIVEVPEGTSDDKVKVSFLVGPRVVDFDNRNHIIGKVLSHSTVSVEDLATTDLPTQVFTEGQYLAAIDRSLSRASRLNPSYLYQEVLRFLQPPKENYDKSMIELILIVEKEIQQGRLILHKDRSGGLGKKDK